ncbi:MAG TPA: hypothetical protein VFU29_01105 [Chitinophagaceae bacterium]|nr:hypothetical protein [Chitinophagaceae bacterium]
MKKLTISSAILMFAVFVMSCNKQADVVSRPTTGTTVATAPPDTTTIVSDWFSLSVDQLSDDMGGVYLQGMKPFDNQAAYNRDIHVELAYVSMPGQQAAVISHLPMNLELSQGTSDHTYGFSFWMDNAGFFLSIQNLNDATIAPDPSIIQDFKFRYIIIPRQVYDSLGIDWDNYDEVAQALNL